MAAATVSFEFLYKKHYRQVFGYIYKKLNNADEAEDMTQEVFVKCYEKFDDFDPEKASFQTWLFVIVNNKLKNHYRNKKTVVDIDDPETYDEPAEEGFEDEVGQAVYLQQMRDELALALDLLNDKQRQIIIMSYFEKKSSKEIGFALGMNDGNVRVTQKRALQKLSEHFAAKGIEWEL